MLDMYRTMPVEKRLKTAVLRLQQLELVRIKRVQRPQMSLMLIR